MDNADGETRSKKRVRDDSEEGSAPNSPETKRIREDLLEILDDSDAPADREPVIQDLDSVIKSFEEEILPSVAVDQASDSGDSLPELGYLLEASDDELGIPPAISPCREGENDEISDLRRNLPVELEGMAGFEDEILPSYDSFGLGIYGDFRDYGDMNGDYVTLGGLFDSDYSEFLWRQESMPAV